MSSPAKEIKIEFEKVDDGSTHQGKVTKLEVSFYDGTPDKDWADLPNDGQPGEASGITHANLQFVQTNPYCINIGGRRYCW